MYLKQTVHCILVEKSLELEKCNLLGTWEHISLELNLVTMPTKLHGKGSIIMGHLS